MIGMKTPWSVRVDAFSKIAFWQLMAFTVLLCFVWAAETIDLPNIVFDTEPQPFNFYRASLLTAAIITAAIIAVGHTYEQQKAVIRQLLMTCTYCHRVKTDAITWEHVEEYFLKHYPLDVRRGCCPECEAMLQDLSKHTQGKTADE